MLWAFEYGYKESALQVQEKKVGDIKDDSRYLFVNGLHDESEILKFVKIAGKWREATFQQGKAGIFRWLMDCGDEAHEKARQAAKNLQALLNKNGNEIYFKMDKQAISQDCFMSSASMGKAVNDISVMEELSYSVKNAPNGRIHTTGYTRVLSQILWCSLYKGIRQILQSCQNGSGG